MIPLYAPLPYSVEYKSRRYKLLPYFDRVLEALDTVSRQDVMPADAIGYALELLTDERKTPLDYSLLQAIFDTLIEPAKEQAPRAVDFRQDAALIYAGFMQAYHIDLREEQHMHWWTFSALLSGLPSDTRLMEIVRIRTMDVPKATKHNAEQISEIMRLKAKYRIVLSEDEAKAQYQHSLQGLAQRLMES